MGLGVLQEDQDILRELAKKAKDPRERERLRALYILSLGETVERVMAFFTVDESTVYRWIERWTQERSMHDRPRDGRPPTVGPTEKKEIKKLLAENDPKKHGLNAHCWDTKELQTYFTAKGKHYSREAIRTALHGLGARYVKAQFEFREAKAEEQTSFATRFLQDMTMKPDAVVVLFQDEMSARTTPNKGYGWTLDKRLTVKVPGYRGQRVNCFGAVDPFKGEVTELSSTCPKADSFVRFLRKLRKRYTGKLWIYLDNFPVHKSRKVNRFIEADGKIELRYLPRYSPEMNPQEQWHNYKRAKFLDNQVFTSGRHLALSMSAFARNTSPEVIKSVCSLEPIYRHLP
jgi:putative transposase